MLVPHSTQYLFNKWAEMLNIKLKPVSLKISLSP